MGELANQAARARSEGVKNVVATDECDFITIEAEQTGNWMRTEGQDLVTNWLSAGIEFDAIFSNNDEMAIGAIQALRSAGRNPQEVVIGGSDATQDALAAMRAGDLDATVFQDARGQGQGAVDAALALARGENVDQKVYIPYPLFTPENIAEFEQVN
jgi:inositol transport system substrate-binding protein